MDTRASRKRKVRAKAARGGKLPSIVIIPTNDADAVKEKAGLVVDDAAKHEAMVVGMEAATVTDSSWSEKRKVYEPDEDVEMINGIEETSSFDRLEVLKNEMFENVFGPRTTSAIPTPFGTTVETIPEDELPDSKVEESTLENQSISIETAGDVERPGDSTWEDSIMDEKQLRALYHKMDSICMDVRGGDTLGQMKKNIDDLQNAIEHFETAMAFRISVGEETGFVQALLLSLLDYKDDAQSLYEDEFNNGPPKDDMDCSYSFEDQEQLEILIAMSMSMTTENEVAPHQAESDNNLLTELHKQPSPPLVFSPEQLNDFALPEAGFMTWEPFPHAPLEDTDNVIIQRANSLEPPKDRSALEPDTDSDSETSLPDWDLYSTSDPHKLANNEFQQRDTVSGPMENHSTLGHDTGLKESLQSLQSLHVTLSDAQEQKKQQRDDNLDKWKYDDYCDPTRDFSHNFRFIPNSKDWREKLNQDGMQEKAARRSERKKMRKRLVEQAKIDGEHSLKEDRHTHELEVAGRAARLLARGIPQKVLERQWSVSFGDVRAFDGCVETREPIKEVASKTGNFREKSPPWDHNGSSYDMGKLRLVGELCTPLVKNRRSSAPCVPKEHIQRIDEFVEAMNENRIHAGTASYHNRGVPSDQFLRSFSVVIKVNIMDNEIRLPPIRSEGSASWAVKPHVKGSEYPRQSKSIKREQSTSIYVLDPITSRYIRIDYDGRLLEFVPEGYGSYQSYQCRRNKTYRIGYFKKTWKRSLSSDRRMSYGCGMLDVVMGLCTTGQIKEEVRNHQHYLRRNRIESLDQRIDNDEFDNDYLTNTVFPGLPRIGW